MRPAIRAGVGRTSKRRFAAVAFIDQTLLAFINPKQLEIPMLAVLAIRANVAQDVLRSRLLENTRSARRAHVAVREKDRYHWHGNCSVSIIERSLRTSFAFEFASTKKCPVG